MAQGERPPAEHCCDGELGPHLGDRRYRQDLVKQQQLEAGQACRGDLDEEIVGLVSSESLVAISAMLFLAVYLADMAAVFRALRGPARWGAVPAIFVGPCG